MSKFQFYHALTIEHEKEKWNEYLHNRDNNKYFTLKDEFKNKFEILNLIYFRNIIGLDNNNVLFSTLGFSLYKSNFMYNKIKQKRRESYKNYNFDLRLSVQVNKFNILLIRDIDDEEYKNFIEPIWYKYFISHEFIQVYRLSNKKENNLNNYDIYMYIISKFKRETKKFQLFLDNYYQEKGIGKQLFDIEFS